MSRNQKRTSQVQSKPPAANARHKRVAANPVQDILNSVEALQNGILLPGRGTASLRHAQLLQMQRQHGNSFVSRQLQRQNTLANPRSAYQKESPPKPTLAAVQSMGKLVIGYTDTLPGLLLQTEGADPGSTPVSAEETKSSAALTNGRFAGIKNLETILQGEGELSKKHNGAAVKAVQQALFDMGYPLPRFRVDGKIGSETREAIRRFREDHKFPPGTALDGPAMAALDKVAPAPGTTAKKSIDYDKLLKDGKLTFTVAIGYDDHDWHVGATKKMLDFFSASGFKGAIGADGLGLFSKDETFLLPDSDTDGFKGKIVKVQIRFITPDTKNAKKQFAKGLSADDISIYSGHARYGTGPDFDSKKTAAENFTIGVGSALHKSGKLKRPPGMDYKWYKGHGKMQKVLDKRANDLEKMEKAGKLDPKKYQVWFLNACSTLHYMDELRSPELAGSKDRKNLDVIGTRKSIYLDAEIEAAKAFITSVMNSDTLDQLMGNMQGAVDKWVDDNTAEGKGPSDQTDMFFREGFGDNPKG